MMPRLILIFTFQLIAPRLFGQSDFSFHPPVKIPMVLSGNFGEIRPDHFHSGIDIKTQGTTGHHIFSIDDGYVSRIKVQANGYGKSIYISHPGGYTSVYGHLDRYREDIADYVKKVQYQRRSHMVDLYLDPGEFRLEKGEFIAYSGNSGSSSGPHLHFEVRTSADQHPTNVLKYGFSIEDRVEPRFFKILVYPVDDTGIVNGSRNKLSSRLVRDRGSYTVPFGTELRAAGKLGLAVEVFDYLNGASNRCGVYSLEMYVDDRLRYKHVMDEFAFSETRYVNAHIEYGERILNQTKAHRLHRLPNDRLRIYEKLEEEGLLNITESRDYNIRIVATDVAGNQSVAAFKITGEPGAVAEDMEPAGPSVFMKHDGRNFFENDRVSLELPARALYQDLNFTFAITEAPEGAISEMFHIHSAEVPVHLPYTLSIKADGVDPALRGKLLMVTTGEGDELYPAGGEYRDGKVVAQLRNFGGFALCVDTIPPEIKAINGKASGNLSGRKTLSFFTRDDLSGIEKYEGYIDNQWALFEYDPKHDLLTYTFDSERITRDSQHELELYVSDAKGNVNLFHTIFTW